MAPSELILAPGRSISVIALFLGSATIEDDKENEDDEGGGVKVLRCIPPSESRYTAGFHECAGL
jgi:hypothetical protein